jgi:predicted transcriptional regulator
MDSNELKFLLKLLGCPHYRSYLAKNEITKTFDSIKNKNKICQDLGTRGLVDYSREIASVKILPPGRALLKMDTTQLPIAPNELKVLEALGKVSEKIPPSKISVKSVKSAERDTILETLRDRGLIEAEIQIKTRKAEVWLTPRGQEFLRDDYNPKGLATITLDLLGNYLHFLRKSLSAETLSVTPPQPEQILTLQPQQSPPKSTGELSDDHILQTIRDLDRELNTDNYLPIFHLREKFKDLSREQFDQAIYRLQRQDKIELSSLQEGMSYTPEQIEAAIHQEFGRPLFFIMVN